jgi:hypothetical protein
MTVPTALDLQPIVKRLVLDVEWSDGARQRITGENLLAYIEVAGLSADLSPSLVVDVIHMVDLHPRYELVIRCRQYGAKSRFVLEYPDASTS